MKKRGKIASSRIEFGLDALKEELENKKTKVKISNFLRKKSSNAKKHNVKKLNQKKHKKSIFKVKKHKPKVVSKVKKHKIPSNIHKPKVKIIFPGISPKKEIKEEIKEKVPSHLFRYNWQKRKKKKDQIQTQKEIKEVTKKIKTTPHQIKEPKINKHKLKNIKIIIAIVSLFLLLFLLSKANLTSLPSNVSVFIITLLSIVLILFLLIIIFSKKKKNTHKQEGEIDINQARLIPIEIRKLKMPETYFDLVIEIVNKRGIITISELAKTFRITKERAEEWAIILADHNLITLYYPPIGEPILKKIVKKNKEEEKNNAKTNP